MERVTVLMPDERSRLRLFDLMRKRFCETGDIGCYQFPPSIILSESTDYSMTVDIGDGIFHVHSRPEIIKGMAICPIWDERLIRLSGGGTPGLFLGKKDSSEEMDMEVSVKSIAIVEYDTISYRIVRERPLRKSAGN